MKPTPEEVAEWVRLYMEEKRSWEWIALEVGRNPQTVRKLALEAGAVSRKPGTKSNAISNGSGPQVARESGGAIRKVALHSRTGHRRRGGFR